MTNEIIIKKLEDILELITDDGGNIEDVIQALNSIISDLEYPNINDYGDDDWAAPGGED
jgi:hypothetical protein|tara:strand:+ start:1295 stop:1471 length:177 start_codon:yes stop_codon:yes gene_type:complete